MTKFPSLNRLINRELRLHFSDKSFLVYNPTLYLTLDFILGQLIFGPIVIITFRGMWKNVDMIFLQLGCNKYQSVLAFVLGSACIIFVCMIHYPLKDLLTPADKVFTTRGIWFYLCTRLFCWFNLFSVALIWKGYWDNLDTMKREKRMGPNLTLSFILASFLICIRSFKIIMSSPLGTEFYLDVRYRYMELTTAWMFHRTSPLIDRLIDAFMTLLLTCLAITAYHGVWVALDDCMAITGFHPKDWSAAMQTVSFASGAVSFLFQFVNLRIHEKDLHWLYKFLFNELVLLAEYVCDVCMYHGVWKLMDSVFDEKSLKCDRFGSLIFHKDQNYENLTNAVVRKMSYDTDITFVANCEENKAKLEARFFCDTISQVLGFIMMVTLGISSTLLIGVGRERHRKIEGLLTPKFYLTYLFREKSACVSSPS